MTLCAFAAVQIAIAANNETAKWHLGEARLGPPNATTGWRDVTNIIPIWFNHPGSGTPSQKTECEATRNSAIGTLKACNPADKTWSDASNKSPIVGPGTGHGYSLLAYTKTETVNVKLVSDSGHNIDFNLVPPAANAFGAVYRKHFVKALQNGKKYVSVSYTYKRGSGVNPTGGKTITLEYKKAGGAWNALNLFGVDLDTSGVHTPFVALPCTDIHNSISLKGKVFFLRLTSDGDVLDTFTIDDCGNKTAFYQTIPSNSTVNACETVVVALKDENNDPATIGVDMPMNLTSDKPALFYSTSGCGGSPISSITFPADENDITYYFKPLAAGTHYVVADAPDAESFGVTMETQGYVTVTGSEYCGNYITDSSAGEACDSGGYDSYTCTASCAMTVCGDNHLNTAASEACDDGNTIGGDGCSSTCSTESCGNYITDVGEQCDSGGYDNSTCDASCTMSYCGNGHLNTSAGEACDDANTDGGDGCSATCAIEVCGNYITDVGELCDSGGYNSTTCDANCTMATCGDNYLNTSAGEACDDGNTTGGDGCSATCAIEVCGNYITDVGEQCDSGSFNSSMCDANCTMATCGDGYMNSSASEACDDGNTTSGDGCSSTCSMEYCGNFICESNENNSTCPMDCWY